MRCSGDLRLNSLDCGTVYWLFSRGAGARFSAGYNSVARLGSVTPPSCFFGCWYCLNSGDVRRGASAGIRSWQAFPKNISIPTEKTMEARVINGVRT